MARALIFHMTTGTDTPRNERGLAVVLLTDQAEEVIGTHMARSSVDLAPEGTLIQADQVLQRA